MNLYITFYTIILIVNSTITKLINHLYLNEFFLYYTVYIYFNMNITSLIEDNKTKYMRKLFRMYKTISEMLIDRGYNIDKTENKVFEYTFQEFLDNEDILLTTITIKPLNPNDKNLMIFFSQEETMGIKPVQNILSSLKDNNSDHAILILKKSLTPFARKMISDNNEFRIEIFEQEDLIVNITKHPYASKHIILTNDQKIEFFKTSRLQESQIPRILSSDPIAKYYGIKRGQLIKIVELDKHNKNMYYMIVV